MGIGILDALIPARFILTMGHLVSLLTLAYTIKVCGQDCESTLSRMPGEYGKAKKEFETIVILSLTCFVFDLMGIFIGTSLFFPRANLLQIICHFAGGCVISLIIAQSWQYNYIW